MPTAALVTAGFVLLILLLLGLLRLLTGSTPVEVFGIGLRRFGVSEATLKRLGIPHHASVYRDLNESELVQSTGHVLGEKVFTGGPVRDFEVSGRAQLITLLRVGLYPDSKVLDVGCGCVRAGYWLIHFLDRGGYCGIEPNTEMLRAGIDELLPAQLIEDKQPRFDSNQEFDFSVFGEEFDFALAFSIWSHASKPQIAQMLSSFARTASPKGVFLASYRKAGLLERDYRGDEWVGRSHESEVAGMVAHSFRWIESECARNGLRVRETGFERLANQRWLYITRR